jgi:DNA-3-methyladenine glycosylase
MGRLPRAFYARPAVEVAPDLLGRIVETEAYERDDPASHAFAGETPRNRTMFGPPGHLYVYFTYGMHWCMNAVTGPVGDGSAVLLRAGEPVEGFDAMMANRGTDRIRDLCRGPARWARAFRVNGDQDGVDLVRGREVWVEPGSPVPQEVITRGPRVGVRQAAEVPWRFHVAGSRWVSLGPATGPAQGRSRRRS